MPQKFTRLLTAFAGTLLAGTSLASAAEVTQQRLLNPEPQNILALRIIEIAQLGERDPNRLRDDALLYLTRTNLRSTGL